MTCCVTSGLAADMQVAGAYIGQGLGDVSEEIRLEKAFMRRKFSYAKQLEDTRTYDPQMVSVVAEMQGRYNQDGKLATGKYTSGVINLETKYVMGYVERPPGPDNRPVLFTVCGTGVPYWVGPDADTARAVEDKWRWQACAYPAAPFPMGPSINGGKTEVRTQFNRDEPGFQLRKQVERNGAGLAIYSQGAVVGSEVWEFDIKPDNGTLHWAKDHMLKAVAWGNPSREVGAAYPDPGEQMAPANTGGVAAPADRMKDTPPWWRNYAHKGDLYTTGSNDAAGQDKTAIWRIIRGEKFFIGPDTLLEQFLEIAKEPIPGAIGAFKAMMDAGMFIGHGLTSHTNYNIGPAIDYLRAA
jgi:hypothetical protein